MASGDALRPGPPPAFESPEWQADADEVIEVNDTLTDDQIRIARFWADGAGTDTPPGHWMRIAMGLAGRDQLNLPDTVRLLAHVAMAQADAFIACWDAKFTYWSGRPVGLIPGFASTIITPNFPSYISGHSTLSGASSVVLAAFFPADAATLTAQAEEAAVSRLYGGIHWHSDNEVGLVVGRQVGELAVERLMRDGGLR
jgi:membrane-associated phospholipid phosphatase